MAPFWLRVAHLPSRPDRELGSQSLRHLFLVSTLAAGLGGAGVASLQLHLWGSIIDHPAQAGEVQHAARVLEEMGCMPNETESVGSLQNVEAVSVKTNAQGQRGVETFTVLTSILPRWSLGTWDEAGERTQSVGNFLAVPKQVVSAGTLLMAGAACASTCPAPHRPAP